MHWTPPAGFEEVASQVEGIRVFAPAVDMGGAPRTFQCGRCGDERRWTVEAAALACPSCGHVEEPDGASDVGAGSEIVDSDRFTEDALTSAPRGWGRERRELGCGSCGARISLAEGALCASCPFCASSQVEVHDPPPGGLRPRAIVPFQIQHGAARGAIQSWLGRGWMHPGALQGGAALERLQGIYLPCWSFSASVEAEWDAEVGHTHYRTVSDGRGGTRQEPYTVWRWEDGDVALRIEDHQVFGTARVTPALLAQLGDFALEARAPYDPSFLAGWQALAYDVPLREAWARGREAMREQARAACQSDASTHQVRNLSVDADLQDESWRLVLLPIYTTSYQYKGQTFQVLVNGQGGGVVGHKPVVWWRVWAAIGALWGAAIGALIVPPVGPFALLGAGIASFFLYRAASRAEGS